MEATILLFGRYFITSFLLASFHVMASQRITREARAQGNAHKDPHPNILRITACINISSLSIYPALVIPWCDGGDLIGYLTSTEVGYIDRLRLVCTI